MDHRSELRFSRNQTGLQRHQRLLSRDGAARRLEIWTVAGFAQRRRRKRLLRESQLPPASDNEFGFLFYYVNNEQEREVELIFDNTPLRIALLHHAFLFFEHAQLQHDVPRHPQHRLSVGHLQD